MKTSHLLKVCVWAALSALAPGGIANSLASPASPPNLEAGQALLGIETHRAAIINRLLSDYAQEMAQRKLDAAVLRTELNLLRADQLLAATLVNTLDEVLQVVQEPMPTVGQRYVAITPTEALELRALPEAQAYLVRDGEALSVVKAGELQLNGRNRVVGYFTTDTVTSVTTVIQEKPVVKDGPGTGANSWIGYTAGSNQASGTGSAVAAGTFNAATAQGAFVGAGTSNVAAGISSLVIGGFDNQARVIDALVVAGAGNRATGARSVVVGGGYNLASGQWSFIGGGGRQSGPGAAGTFHEDHVAAGDFSTIGGGQGNRAGTVADPGMRYATVGGGGFNSASGSNSTVAGGNSNVGSGVGSTVAGGYFNMASGIASAVGGGEANTASGNASTVAGGKSNLSGGTYSFAAGYRAKVYVDGSFVFSDSTEADFSSGIANEFLVGATGGIGLYTAKNYTTGCHIVAGSGSWSCTSSRDVKRDFETVDVEEVLHKVLELPMLKWRFMNEDAAIRHLGPMAQDFRAAFGLGTDDRTIATVDENGIALAAIQGLNQKLDQKDAKIDRLERELVMIKRKLGLD